jgi:hypothetical protein
MGIAWIYKLLIFVSLLTAPASAFDPTPLGQEQATNYFIHLNLIPRLDCALGTGSGVIISPTEVLTAAHVVQGSEVCLINGTPARVIHRDVEADIAVLEYQSPFGSSRIAVSCEPFRHNQMYYSVGWARGTDLVVQRLISTGEYSDLNVITPGARMVYPRLHILFGWIYGGQSGGPIVDDNGFVIGINNTRDALGRPIAGSRELRGTYLCENGGPTGI